MSNVTCDSEASDYVMHLGGMVRTPGPFAAVIDGTKLREATEAFIGSINEGMAALENGTLQFAPHIEPVPGAAVETFDIFDVETGDHVMIWRVATRERSKHAN